MESKGVFYILLCSFCWSVTIVVSRVLVGLMSPESAGLLTRVLAVLIWSVLLRLRIKKVPWRASLRIGWWIGLVGFTAFGINLLLLFALKFTTATNAAILSRGDILFSIVIGHIMFKEKMSVFEVVCIIVVLFGALQVMDLDFHRFEFKFYGDLMLIIASLLLAVNAFIIREKLLPSIGPEYAGYFNLAVQIPFFLGAVLLRGQWTEINIDYSTVKTISIAASVIAAAQIIMMISYYQSLRLLQMWLVRIFLLTIVPVTVISSYILLRESLKASQAVGIFTMLTSLAVLVRYRREKR